MKAFQPVYLQKESGHPRIKYPVFSFFAEVFFSPENFQLSRPTDTGKRCLLPLIFHFPVLSFHL